MDIIVHQGYESRLTDKSTPFQEDSWFSFELDRYSTLFAQQLIQSSNFGDSETPWVWLPKCINANPKAAPRQASSFTCDQKAFKNPQEQILENNFGSFRIE